MMMMITINIKGKQHKKVEMTVNKRIRIEPNVIPRSLKHVDKVDLSGPVFYSYTIN